MAEMTKPRRGRPPGLKDAPDVRSRLLETADRLFYAEGIRAVGIDRILAESGAAKASLYAHFSGKDELVAAYLDARATQTRTLVSQTIERAGPDPRARLLALFDMAAASAEGPGFRGCHFQIAAAELPDASHPASPVFRDQRAWFAALIDSLVAGAVPDAPPQLARAVVSLYEGAVSQAPCGSGREAMLSARWAVERLISGTHSTT